MVAVQQTARASSTDEKRPVLTGTLVEKNVADSSPQAGRDRQLQAFLERDRRRWIGGRLGRLHHPHQDHERGREARRRSSDADVEMKMQDKQMMFKIGDLVISSRLIEGQFPNYKQLVPKGEKTYGQSGQGGADRGGEEGAHLRAQHAGRRIQRPPAGSLPRRPRSETPRKRYRRRSAGEEMEIGFNGTYLMDGAGGSREPRRSR